MLTHKSKFVKMLATEISLSFTFVTDGWFAAHLATGKKRAARVKTLPAWSQDELTKRSNPGNGLVLDPATRHTSRSYGCRTNNPVINRSSSVQELPLRLTTRGHHNPYTHRECRCLEEI
jgi:hypothetical protein